MVIPRLPCNCPNKTEQNLFDPKSNIYRYTRITSKYVIHLQRNAFSFALVTFRVGMFVHSLALTMHTLAFIFYYIPI